MAHNFFLNALYEVYPDWVGRINIDGEKVELTTTSGEDVDIDRVKAHLAEIKPRLDSMVELEELDVKLPRYAEASILSLEGTDFEDVYLIGIAKRKIKLRGEL